MSKSIQFYGPQMYISSKKPLLLNPHIKSCKITVTDENNNQLTFSNPHDNYFHLYNNTYFSNYNKISSTTIETGTKIEINAEFSNLIQNIHRLILKNNKLVINCIDINLYVKNDIGFVIKTLNYKNAIFEYIIDDNYISKLEKFIVRAAKQTNLN